MTELQWSGIVACMIVAVAAWWFVNFGVKPPKDPWED